MQQALDPLSRALPVSPADVSQTRLWLIQAGYRSPQHVTIYRGLRVLFAAIGFFSVLLFTGFNSPLLLVGLTGFGYFIPRFLLKKRLQERQRRIRLGLPDGLDLTVICVEAGLSLDQAMMRVGEDLRTAHPELSGEFHLFDLETRAGKPRVEALRNLAERTGVDDIRSLVGTLIQTDRFGTSVAQALRVHSDSLRTERRQRAEEQAAKTTVKMIIPLVLFVMPSLIFVTVGPAVIQLLHIFLPTGGKR
jgi:tight adherence protein C